MALLFTILSRILSSVVSATGFGGANVFNMVTDHSAKECKRHDLALKKLQRAMDKWNEDRMKRLDFINKRLREKNEAGYTSTTLMKQCLSTIAYLQKKALATCASIIRFLSSIRDTKKW